MNIRVKTGGVEIKVWYSYIGARSRGEDLRVNEYDRYMPIYFFYIYTLIIIYAISSFLHSIVSFWIIFLPAEFALVSFCLFSCTSLLANLLLVLKCIYFTCSFEDYFISHGLFRLAVIFYLYYKVSFHYPVAVILSIERLPSPLKIFLFLGDLTVSFSSVLIWYMLEWVPLYLSTLGLSEFF